MSVPERNFSMDLVRVTEAAALASARWLGKGNTDAGDGADNEDNACSPSGSRVSFSAASAERAASAQLTYWRDYDPFAQAVFIDFVHNKGSDALATSTMRRKANAGDLLGACRECRACRHQQDSAKKFDLHVSLPSER